MGLTKTKILRRIWSSVQQSEKIFWISGFSRRLAPHFILWNFHVIWKNKSRVMAAPVIQNERSIRFQCPGATEFTETAKSRITELESEAVIEEMPGRFCAEAGCRLFIKAESHWNNELRDTGNENPKKDSGRKGTDRRIKYGMQR